VKKLIIVGIVALALLAGAYQVQAFPQDLLRKTQIDQATGVKYSLLAIDKMSKKQLVNPCGSVWMTNVIGEVPEKIDLSDDDTAKLLLKKGADYVRSQCGGKVPNYTHILLFQDSFVQRVGQGDLESWVVNQSYGMFEYLDSTENKAMQAKSDVRFKEKRAQEEAVMRRDEAIRETMRLEALKVQQYKEQQKKQEIAGMRESFVKKNGVQAWPAADALIANPFVFQGKTVAVISRFEEMSSATDGLFMVGGSPVFVTDIPIGMFTSKHWMLLAGTVVGKKEIQLPMAGKMAVTHLKYAGSLNCADQECNGWGAK